MQSLFTRLSAFVLAVAAVLSACETDIEVIAPKRDVTIIYGLLEANKTRHFIRINQAFVGEESATVLAAQTGINEYADSELSAKIIELSADGKTPTGNTWVLKPMYIHDKEEGDFASDSNKVYYFDATLDADLQYKIECTVTVEGEEAKTVWAVTDILGNKSTTGGNTLEPLILHKPRLSGNSLAADRTNDEVVIFNRTNQDYVPAFEVTWAATEGGVTYTTFMRLYYRDYDRNTGKLISSDSVMLPLGTRNFEGVSGQVTFPSVNTVEMYATIGKEVADLDTTTSPVRRIVSDTVQFFLQVANKELSTYMEINQPATNVAQERPEYTNVNNGIGIFASRFSTSTRDKSVLRDGRILDSGSLTELLYCESAKSKRYTASKAFTRPGRCVVLSTGPRCD